MLIYQKCSKYHKNFKGFEFWSEQNPKQKISDTVSLQQTSKNKTKKWNSFLTIKMFVKLCKIKISGWIRTELWNLSRHGLQHRHALPDVDARLPLHPRLQVEDDQGHGRRHAGPLCRLCCDLSGPVLLLVCLPNLVWTQCTLPVKSGTIFQTKPKLPGASKPVKIVLLLHKMLLEIIALHSWFIYL